MTQRIIAKDSSLILSLSKEEGLMLRQPPQGATMVCVAVR